jgi:hypothetical protein
VLNAREACWHESEGRAFQRASRAEETFGSWGWGLNVLGPGVAHGDVPLGNRTGRLPRALPRGWLIVEGEERPLRQWGFVHCPVETKHTIVGAGERL